MLSDKRRRLDGFALPRQAVANFCVAVVCRRLQRQDLQRGQQQVDSISELLRSRLLSAVVEFGDPADGYYETAR